MAWTAPASYSVAEVVTAAKLNLHIRDNLKYLKGQAGTVTIEDQIALTVNTNASNGLTITNASAGASAFAHINLINDGGSAAGFFRGSSGTSAYAGANALNIGMIGAHPLALFTNNTVRQTIASDGAIKFTGAGGGFMYLSAAAVAGGLVTLAPAGTVTVGMTVWLSDRNNGAGAYAAGFNGQVMALTATQNYVNTDTLTLTLTAGGAITVQRTVGTNGTHDVNMFCLYR